ncbi:hypothetical protein [Conexibacter sp. CPCC 206217]|uniref:DUF7714 family protein n=1 Tax=Conexibacter sp. CPCC 206217 TaxID=3064574 RepID=UPI00272517A4|nr:hypothetical protein [Conexibacter sp. CPCC 206217]MDO8212354.1 hypothetical protein [Conexibacter sp. CPCC 206217]
MIDLPANFIVRPYRGVSVQRVPSVEPTALRERLLGRRVYRRTEFVVAECGGERAVVRIERAEGDGILVPVRDAEVVASGDEVVFVDDERVDVGNATQLARAALGAAAAGARIHVVQGRFQHVNFIVDPQPLTIRVVEAVPPQPPKLLEMARAMVEVDEDLPPIAFELVAIDLRTLIAQNPAPRYLLPCRSGGIDPALPVEFLDEGPADDPSWTLVGCERSREIHVAMYGREPRERVDFCPRVRVPDDGSTTLSRCCLLERGIERDGGQMLVPWGANLDEVRTALRLLCGLPAEPARARAVQPEPLGAHPAAPGSVAGAAR